MKVNGSYDSVIRGVSQQVPQDRRSGQMNSQYNMISDPVRGLSRRRGSLFNGESSRGAYSPMQVANINNDRKRHKTAQLSIDGAVHDIIYRSSPANYLGYEDELLTVYSRNTQEFLPVVYPNAPVMLAAFNASGISTPVSLGKYTVLAGRGHVPTATIIPKWDTIPDGNGETKFAVQARGAAYAKTFTLEFTEASGNVITATYKSPSSGYPGVLDTSDLRTETINTGGSNVTLDKTFVLSPSGVVNPTNFWARVSISSVTDLTTGLVLTFTPGEPAATQYTTTTDTVRVSPTLAGHRLRVIYVRYAVETNLSYQEEVSNRTNLYNSAVTAWITSSANGASPEGIAEGLHLAVLAAFAAAGRSAPGIVRYGSHLLIRNSFTGVTGSRVVELSGDDSGDGSLLRVVGREINDVALVTQRHFPGHVVRVRPKDGDSEKVTYLQAFVADVAGANDSTQGADVVWRECAGTVVQPADVFLYGTIEFSSVLGKNCLLLGRSGLELTTMRVAYGVAPSTDTPDLLPSVAGDLITDPVPEFLGRFISYLGLFQDRLVIASGSKVFMSRPGDYFNFFRRSTLTVEDDDPLEVQAYGSESDIIRSAVTYDRNYILFGDELQYIVSGRQAITPKNAAINIMSAYGAAVDASPVASGNFVFFCRKNAGSTTVHQMQPGILSETPVAYQVSSQLDSYLTGTAVELAAFTGPNHLVVRTDGLANTLFLYSYLDSAGASERVFDSWGQWFWTPAMGSITGMSSDAEELLVFLEREHNGILYHACERFSFKTEFNSMPHLDSLRKQPATWTPATSFDGIGDISTISFAFGPNTSRKLVGVPASRMSELVGYTPQEKSELYVGWNAPAAVSPTNPYPRDRNGEAIVNCRLTLGIITLTLANTGGVKVVTMSNAGIVREVLNSKARILGFQNNIIGRQPVSTYTASALIGREIRDVQYEVQAQSWLPLTVTSIEWAGQYLNNVKRM
jgi:hypothetical protein